MKKQFKNGFEVSVIDNGYGSEDGLLELAVAAGDYLHYENDVADGDVRGYLTQKDVERLSKAVEGFADYQKGKNLFYKRDGTTEPIRRENEKTI